MPQSGCIETSLDRKQCLINYTIRHRRSDPINKISAIHLMYVFSKRWFISVVEVLRISSKNFGLPENSKDSFQYIFFHVFSKLKINVFLNVWWCIYSVLPAMSVLASVAGLKCLRHLELTMQGAPIIQLNSIVFPNRVCVEYRDGEKKFVEFCWYTRVRL